MTGCDIPQDIDTGRPAEKYTSRVFFSLKRRACRKRPRACGTPAATAPNALEDPIPLPSQTPPQSFADWCTDIFSQIKKGEHEFCWIVDACAHPDLPDIFWELEDDPQAFTLYEGTSYDDDVESGPWMVPAERHSAVSEWLFAQCEDVPVGCLAEMAPGTFEEVFKHMQGQLEYRLDNGEVTLFRWYDPRTLYAMSTWFDLPTILSAFLGPVLRMHGWEPGRGTGFAFGDGKPSRRRSKGKKSYPYSLIEHIWDEVMIHTIIGTLGLSQGETLRAMPLPEAYALGARTARALSDAGYDDRESLAFAMSVSARLGAGIWDRPEVIAALKERPAGASVSDVLSGLNL